MVHIMKRFLALVLSLACISGCGSQPTETTETATIFNKEKYRQEINNILNQRMWNYNTEEIIYTSDIVVNESSEDFNTLLKASSDLGLDLTKAEGKEAVTAQIELLNIDRSSAGTAYIQFVQEEPVCGYYVYNEGEYSLKNKYPFEVPNAFTAIENPDVKPTFSNEELNNSINEYCDLYDGKIAVINNQNIEFYIFDNYFKLIDRIKYNNLMPMDVAIGKDFNAVLLGTIEATITKECSYEVSDDYEESYILKADSIQFINDNGDAVLPALELDLSTYTSVDFDNDKLIIGRDKGIDIYTLKDGNWVKEIRHSLDHFISQMTIEDIDNDGTNEYIVTDEVNIYIYRPADMLTLLWKTNFDVGTLSGQLYTGDLNNDGVKEIYTTDSNNITFRYTLIDGGFSLTSNEILSRGFSNYIIGDFNNDGICDYICNDENNSYIFKSSF